jgi:hypothetical protein
VDQILHRVRCEDDGGAGSAEPALYIDRGRGADDENLHIFDALHAAKMEIEDAYGGPLEWLRLENRRACRIVHRINLGGYLDEERWPEIQEEMIDAMVRLESALRPHIASLSI